MKKDAQKLSAHVEVIPAARQQMHVLANLLELYAHDFSEFHKLELGPDGRFGYQKPPLYWSEPSRYPFLVKVEGNLAGLALVKKGSEISGNETVWDMAEFFVVRGYRRRGIGTVIAHKVWRRFRGLWEIRVMDSNQAARVFWEGAISIYIGGRLRSARVMRGSECWRLFSFESK